MKRKIVTLLFGAFGGIMAMAQPSAVFTKATVAPIIDGVAESMWNTATVYNIEEPFTGTTPTLGGEGETTFQAMWNADGIYLLIKVTDDVFYPNYAVTPAGYAWEYDKPEIYFDVNYLLKDGLGVSAGKGHYLISPDFTMNKNDGTVFTQSDGVIYSFLVTGSNYVGEFYVPFSKLVDQEGIEVEKTATIGFDITINDRDDQFPGRQRMVWANVGNTNEAYGNMDDCGTITLDGAEETVFVDKIRLTGGAITTDNGTLQIVASFEPTNASNQRVNWSLSPAGYATISEKGILTAKKNGTITVAADAVDGGYASGKTTVEITGQVIQTAELSEIKDGFFAVDGTPSSVWGGDARIVDGVAVCDPPAGGVNPWDYTFRQVINVPQEDKNEPYIFTFKAWSDEVRNFTFDFEDSNNGYSRYGVSSDIESNGSSEWSFDVGKDPMIYTFHVTFSNMAENCHQQLQFMLGKADAVVYIDSVMLTKEADVALGAKSLSNTNKLKVYPNPVGNSDLLTVEIASANAKVEIYNALGQKLIEKLAIGNIAKFDVSSLRKGMYFVRLSDGSSQKFIK